MDQDDRQKYQPQRPDAPKSPGSFHLFSAFGVDVFIHWSWFIVAIFMYQMASQSAYFSSPIWYAIVYLALFVIVTVHEFGHALACKSVGGVAHKIVLWPLGGIAFVSPPQRPGAMLWSIAAGPLVNVALVPVTIALLYIFNVPSAESWSDLQRFLVRLTEINAILLIFNLLPIYPLDGGQILQSILWFFLGLAKSLYITTVIGMMVAAAGGIFALMYQQWILLAIAVFVIYQAYQGFCAAKQLSAAQHDADKRAQDIAGIHRPWK